MLNKILFFCFLILFVLGMDIVFSYHFHLGFLMPDLFIILVIYYAWWRGSMSGQLVGFFVGAVKDGLGVGIFGSNMLIFTIIGYMIGKIVEHIDRESIIHQMVIMLICSLLYILSFYSIQKLLAYHLETFYRLKYFFKPIVNMFYTPLLFFLLTKIGNKWFRVEITNVAK